MYRDDSFTAEDESGAEGGRDCEGEAECQDRRAGRGAFGGQEAEVGHRRRALLEQFLLCGFLRLLSLPGVDVLASQSVNQRRRWV